MDKKFLDSAYNLDGVEVTQAHYDAWAATYEAEITANGYATPGRIARALRKFAPDPAAPVLDFGCGTGLSGLALRLAGFSAIDGTDISAEMLEGARAKDVYRTLWQGSTDGTPPFTPGRYPVIAAIGVIGSGGAPADTLDTLMELLPKGGLMGFSFNDNTLKDKTYEGRVCNWCDPGAAQLLFREHGDHLPGIGMKSTVYVLEKT